MSAHTHEQYTAHTHDSSVFPKRHTLLSIELINQLFISVLLLLLFLVVVVIQCIMNGDRHGDHEDITCSCLFWSMICVSRNKLAPPAATTGKMNARVYSV